MVQSPPSPKKRASLHLENSEQCAGDGVEVGGGRLGREVERSSEELHPEQREDEDEQEEEEEKRHDGRQRVHQSYHKIAKWRPVPEKKRPRDSLVRKHNSW